jgi:aspartate aminotransferase
MIDNQKLSWLPPISLQDSSIMTELAQMLDNFQPSSISEIFNLANQLKAEGEDILDLSIGEPDFLTPDHVKQAAISAINENNTKYTNIEGTLALRQTISNKFKRDNDLDYDPQQVIVDSGAKPLLMHAMQTMLNKGDEVIIPTPCWTSYIGMVKLCDAVCSFVACPEDRGFKLLASDLQASITAKTKLILLNSPSNPTGAAYTHDEMKAITDVLLGHPDVWILADDIYEHITFDGFEFCTPAQVEPLLYDRTLTLNGVSKAYSMTGWRIGFAAGPQKLVNGIKKVLSQSAGNPCSISQAAAISALEGPQELLAERAEIFRQRRNFLAARLNAIAGLRCHKPEGAFYLYPSCEGLIGKTTPDGMLITDSKDFVKYLLNSHGVAAVPGTAFEYDPYFRLSYASSVETLEKAADRIEAACASLLAE